MHNVGSPAYSNGHYISDQVAPNTIILFLHANKEKIKTNKYIKKCTRAWARQVRMEYKYVNATAAHDLLVLIERNLA